MGRKTLALVALLGLSALGALGGCATVGKTFDTTHVNDVKKGTHDKAQVRAWFGEPHQIISPVVQGEPGCVERWQWTHARSVAGSTTSEALVVDFDKDGKVCDNAFSQLKQ